MWLFDQNFVVDTPEDGKRQSKDVKRRRLKFEELFRYISNLCPQYKRKQRDEMRKCCDWYLRFENYQPLDDDDVVLDADGVPAEEEEDDVDNILKALLAFYEDDLCREYMGVYSMFLNQDLFLHSLKNNNEEFIKESLLSGAFKKSIFKADSVVQTILDQLNEGSKIYSLLNTLLLTDITLWNNNYLE